VGIAPVHDSLKRPRPPALQDLAEDNGPPFGSCEARFGASATPPERHAWRIRFVALWGKRRAGSRVVRQKARPFPREAAGAEGTRTDQTPTRPGPGAIRNLGANKTILAVRARDDPARGHRCAPPGERGPPPIHGLECGPIWVPSGRPDSGTGRGATFSGCPAKAAAVDQGDGGALGSPLVRDD